MIKVQCTLKYHLRCRRKYDSNFINNAVPFLWHIEIIAYKKFDDGTVKILHIAKVTIDGNRTAKKREITEAEYERYRSNAKIHVEKRRYEFTNSSLRVLEVAAKVLDDTTSFNPEDFPYMLKDVSDDNSFVGFRVSAHLG